MNNFDQDFDDDPFSLLEMTGDDSFALKAKRLNEIRDYFVDACRPSLAEVKLDELVVASALEVAKVSNSDNSATVVREANQKLNFRIWNHLFDIANLWAFYPPNRQDQWQGKFKKDLLLFSPTNAKVVLRALLSKRGLFLSGKVSSVYGCLSPAGLIQPVDHEKGFFREDLGFNDLGDTSASTLADLLDVASLMMDLETTQISHRPSFVISAAQAQPGEWKELNNNLLTIKWDQDASFLRVKVHPDLAWRLNTVLVQGGHTIGNSYINPPTRIWLTNARRRKGASVTMGFSS